MLMCYTVNCIEFHCSSVCSIRVVEQNSNDSLHLSIQNFTCLIVMYDRNSAHVFG